MTISMAMTITITITVILGVIRELCRVYIGIIQVCHRDIGFKVSKVRTLFSGVPI